MDRFLSKLLVLVTLAVGIVLGGTITIDENGNGVGVSNGSLGNDFTPGGLDNVLVYNLPFSGLQGDVELTDSGFIQDLLRFNGDGTVIFYSDDLDGFDSIGDTPSPPHALHTNLVSIPEIGPEGNNGALYTPTAKQPGFDSSNPSYQFVSDGTVPEPNSLTLALMLAGLGTILYRWIGKRTT
jgi:hypothetical protein